MDEMGLWVRASRLFLSSTLANQNSLMKWITNLIDFSVDREAVLIVFTFRAKLIDKW